MYLQSARPKVHLHVVIRDDLAGAIRNPCYVSYSVYITFVFLLFGVAEHRAQPPSLLFLTTHLDPCPLPFPMMYTIRVIVVCLVLLGTVQSPSLLF